MLKQYLEKDRVEAGCDEAGRGCLAGPVVAAAVILPPDFSNDLLNDSKQLTAKQRASLRTIIEAEAAAWAVAFISPEEIDRINILQASIMAIHKAVAKLAIKPQYLLVDGNRFKPYPGIPHQCIVKGDAKMMSIAAASILAKTHHDEYMETIAKEFPAYGWDRNKGYPTRDHRAAIAAQGTTPYHRMSFRLLDPQLSLF